MRDHLADRNDIFFASARERIHGITPCPIDPETGKINPQTTRFFLKDGRLMDVTHIKPVYYETRDCKWRPLSEVTAHHGNHKIVLDPKALEVMHPRYFKWLQKRQIILGGELTFGYRDGAYWGVQPYHMAYMDTLTAYPDPDPETTTVDGVLINMDVGSFLSVIAQSSSNSANSSFTTHFIENDGDGGSQGSSRYVNLYDTSSIGDTDTITAATVDWYAESITNDGSTSGAQSYIAFLAHSPASNTNLITSDYSRTTKFGSTDLGDSPEFLNGWTASQYNTITLSSAGRETIDKTGVSKWGAMLGWDFEQTTTNLGNGTGPTIRSADYTGTSSDPKLTVTFTVASVSSGYSPLIIMG